MIRAVAPSDFETVYAIINESAQAYKGIIPADRWHEPYMSRQELRAQVQDGVQFWCYQPADVILGVMGLQAKTDVTLIRHAYVRSAFQSAGIGSKLLTYLCQTSHLPILVGTWADARWAIRFYQRHGFELITGPQKDTLLQTYWSIPDRQVETSVVLKKDGASSFFASSVAD